MSPCSRRAAARGQGAGADDQGAINGEGRIVIRVRAVGAETVLARIIRLDGAHARAAKLRRFSAWSTRCPPCSCLRCWPSRCLSRSWAGCGPGVGLDGADPRRGGAGDRCPCALGLATPRHHNRRAWRRATAFIRDAQALETAHRKDTVAFDKTGTLTVNNRPDGVPGRAG